MLKITNKKKVLSIGELVVEIFSKNIGQQFYDIGKEYVGPYPSGAPAIFIDTIGKLGIESGFIGTVGDDDFGKLIINKLNNDNVDTSRIKIIKNISTGLAFTTYFHDESRKFIYYIRECAPGKFSDDLIDEEFVKQFNYLHISGNVLLFSDDAKKACLKAIRIMKDNNARITFDPNVRIEMLSGEDIAETRDMFLNILKKSFILLPSEGEIEFISNINSEKEAVKMIFDNTELEYIAIKKGANGSTIYTRKESINVPTTDKGLVKRDPTGAGDCFGGAFLYGIINDWDIYKAGDFANEVGRETVSKVGPMEGDFNNILNKF